MAKQKGRSASVEVARISVKVSPDTKQFRRELTEDLKKIEDSVKAKIDVEPNMKGFREEVKAKTKGMSTNVKVNADVDKKGFFSKLKGKMTEFPSFGSGINPTGYALIFAGILAVAAPLMGLLTTSLLALPGLIASIAVPIGALMLGMDGLKKAAEKLKAPFEDLKQTMSAKVEEQFAPVFDKLGTIFPTLKEALPSVTQGLADMASAFTSAFTDGEGPERLKSIIGNIGQALADAAPGVGAFTNGILNLINQFTEKFPGMTDWFNNAGKSFSDWIDKLTANGDLSAAFSGLGDTIKAILDALGQLANTGIEFMADPEKVQAFIAILNGALGAINGIVSASSAMYDIGIATAKAFYDMGVAVAEAFENAKQAVANAVENIINIVVVMGANIIDAIKSIDLAAAGRALVQRLIDGIKSMVGAVKDAFGSVLGGIMKLVPHSPAKEGPFSGSGWTDIFTGGQALGNQFGNGLESGLQSTLDMAKDMANRISQAMQSGSAMPNVGSPSDVKQMLAALEAERKRLKIEKNNIPKADKAGRAALQNQMDQITAQKDLLSYQKDRIKNENDYASAAGKDPLAKALGGMMSSPVDFAKATGQQFLSDIGIGGNGIISKALTEGIQYIFQVGSIDDALSIKDREQQKNAVAAFGVRA